jgi:SAM-dependent methyltransferase
MGNLTYKVDTMDSRTHWSNVYQHKTVTEVSWYQAHPQVSLDLIAATGLGPDARLLDVGAGASLLADQLLARGFHDLTLLDVSPEALAVVRDRLESAAETVTFLVEDVLTAPLPTAAFDLWHDRAVFHFLTDTSQKAGYVAQVQRCVRPGGHVVVATFGPDGPEQCSGLPVARYDPEDLHSTFGSAFTLTCSVREAHTTPWGSQQQFTYCYCRLENESIGQQET